MSYTPASTHTSPLVATLNYFDFSASGKNSFGTAVDTHTHTYIFKLIFTYLHTFLLI